MRYIIGVIAIVIILITVIIMLSRGGSDRRPNIEGEEIVTMSDYADRDARVVYTMEGPNVSEEERRAIRITVTRNERIFQILEGYNERVARTEQFSNNDEAYSTLVHSLEIAGYNRERKTSIEEPKGACPLGQRYYYQLNEGDNRVVDLWSTTCRRDEAGNFGGDASLVRNIFQEQIPGYRDFTRDLKLRYW
jgi:hypothetical protein